MKDNYNNNELDRWLREHAEATGEAPAADGWDQPSELVWTTLRAGLDARRKRRRWLWLFVFALGTGLLGGGMAYWKGTGDQATPAVQNSPVAGAAAYSNETPAATQTPATTGDFENLKNFQNPNSAQKGTHTPASTPAQQSVSKIQTNPAIENTQPAQQKTAQTNTHTNTTTATVREQAGTPAARTVPQNDFEHIPDPAPNPEQSAGFGENQSESIAVPMHKGRQPKPNRKKFRPSRLQPCCR